MDLCKVVGSVVSTQKNEKLSGYKLLIVEATTADGTLKGGQLVAMDNVGAGVGEMVLVVKGSSARQANGMASIPTDATIVGIVDAVEVNGEVVFKKFGN